MICIPGSLLYPDQAYVMLCLIGGFRSGSRSVPWYKQDGGTVHSRSGPAPDRRIKRSLQEAKDSLPEGLFAGFMSACSRLIA